MSPGGSAPAVTPIPCLSSSPSTSGTRSGHRRHGYLDLWRADPGVRPATTAAAVADLGAGADALSVGTLAGPRDPHQFRDRTALDRRLEEPHRGPGSEDARRVPNPPDGDSRGYPEGDRRNERLSPTLRPLRAPGLHFTATPRCIEPTILGVLSSKNRSTWTSRNGPFRIKASISTSRRHPSASRRWSGVRRRCHCWMRTDNASLSSEG